MTNKNKFSLLIVVGMFSVTNAATATVLNFKIGEANNVCARDSIYDGDNSPCHICYSTENSYLGDECDADDRNCIINSVLGYGDCDEMMCDLRNTSAWQIHYDGDVANNFNSTGHYTCDSVEGWLYEPGAIPVCDSSNCQSTNWTYYTTGYQKRTYRYCATSTECVSEEQYRCSGGYYGTSSNGTTGCTKCPDSPDYIADWISGKWIKSTEKDTGFSYYGNTSISNCYITNSDDTGYSFMDDSGVYELTDDCYYNVFDFRV